MYHRRIDLRTGDISVVLNALESFNKVSVFKFLRRKSSKRFYKFWRNTSRFLLLFQYALALYLMTEAQMIETF